MKGTLRLPENFISVRENIFSDFDNTVNYSIAEEIKYKPLFAPITAVDYYCMIWWDEMLEMWCAELWTNSVYNASYLSDNLDNLIIELKTEIKNV